MAPIHKKMLAPVCMCLMVLTACAEDIPQPVLPEFGTRLPEDYRQVYATDFSQAEVLNDFEMSDPSAWRLGRADNLPFLELAKGSGNYAPPVRSPHSIALFRRALVGDFVMEVEVEQTDHGKGAHRDVCLFLGFQDPARFYYVHLASAADPHAHNIFRVDNAPRTHIAQHTTTGVAWGRGIRHRIRVERTLTDGAIRVYFNDFETPIMTTVDRTFGMGRVGIGSFDDTNRFYAFRLFSPDAQACDGGDVSLFGASPAPE